MSFFTALTFFGKGPPSVFFASLTRSPIGKDVLVKLTAFLPHFGHFNFL